MIVPTFRFYGADYAMARRETVYAWHKTLKEKAASDKANGVPQHTPYLRFNNSSAATDKLKSGTVADASDYIRFKKNIAFSRR